jgi:hypothetical protein
MHLSSKQEALSMNLSTAERERKRERERDLKLPFVRSHLTINHSVREIKADFNVLSG